MSTPESTVPAVAPSPVRPAEIPMRFEEILRALEAEVTRLERGDLPLEDALAAFEAGMSLVDKGNAALAAAEGKVEELLAVRQGQAQTRPLDPAG